MLFNPINVTAPISVSGYLEYVGGTTASDKNYAVNAYTHIFSPFPMLVFDLFQAYFIVKILFTLSFSVLIPTVVTFVSKIPCSSVYVIFPLAWILFCFVYYN